MSQLPANLIAQATLIANGFETEVSDELYEAVFEIATANGDMPYGTAKARDGDPYEWVANNVYRYL